MLKNKRKQTETIKWKKRK